MWTLGRTFLATWKSMSVAEGDPMDFDFGTIGKGKKKAFNFDKLDVDFNLDGDLNKLSSFKVDISDLDISSPPKNGGKSKERSKESAVGNHKQKQDRFSLSFDFNELDSFSFESSLTKVGKQYNKNQNGVAKSNRNEFHGPGPGLTDAIDASEIDLAPKLPASVSATTSKIESPFLGHGDLDSIKKNSPSSSARNDNSPSKSATLQNEVAPMETRIMSEKTATTFTQEKNQESHEQEKISSPEAYAQETVQDLSVQSVSENESTQNTSSELQLEVSSMATKAIINAGAEQNVICKSVDGLGFNCENPVLQNSPAEHMARSLHNNYESNKFGSSNNVSICDAGTEPAQDDSYSEDISTISVSMEAMDVMKASGDDQNANRKTQLAPLSSGNFFSKLIETKERESRISLSKFFKKSDEMKSQSPQAPSTQAKANMFGGQKIGYGQKGAADGGREGTAARDAQSGSKLLGISRTHSGELNKGEPVQPGSRSSVKGLKGVGELLGANVTLKGSQLFDLSRLHDRGVTKGEAVQGSEKNIKNLTNFSYCFKPSSTSEQTNKSTTQNNTSPRLPTSRVISVENSKNLCGEENRISSPKAGRSILDLSSFKISRPAGSNPHPSKSTFQKEIKSLRNTQKIIKRQGSTVSKIAHSVCTEKRTPLTPSQKRKTLEGLNGDMLTLNPSKRFSPSQTDSRNEECSERVVEKEVRSHENPPPGNADNASTDHGISTLDIPQDVDMKELEIPLVTENDVNVEKAEAYTKELENICNMLKKKHEEAKEILVRAIVNNNNLLMLNHPIYEEKIRKVQKFAAQLMFK
ncbi:hypothetical protein CEY00_Acc25139 [Actinidia chinensis var. chinensis]|uniref:Uncharacterized protein n=1 Tax=Actinidia chinensis var. chinensis TaxID=1590841 RepID=A0A2R6PXY9_ACTCC|nr:hypothetical protein CEY00_Acc25139 [Actinidia chinensis var. chinensis]